MGEQTGKALWARPTLWKSAVVIAPLAGAALFIATGTSAQTSGSTAPPNPPTASTTVVPKPAPVAARSKGPKLRDKVDRVTGPSPTTDPATPTQTTVPVAPIDAPVEERRKEGPKGDVDHGLTETPAPDTQLAGRRRKGPKGDSDSGRTSTTPLIIGALGAATVLALVVSSGNDRPTSP